MKKLNERVKNIPLVGPVLTKIYRRIQGIPSFNTSKEYWEERYRLGGNSGSGSYNNLAVFKADVLNGFVNENNIQVVLELGCGDGNQLKFFDFKKYIGYDVSQKAIEICKSIFQADSTKTFKILVDKTEDKADLTLSLDVIYHLVEDETFNEYMSNLFDASEKMVIIYSSNTTDQMNNKDTKHVRHRKFTDWVELNRPNFNLITVIPNKYPFNGDEKTTSFADFYIFQKQD